ncbi:MAG: restriction endonuclease subunit S [Syntrophaceae bacterium]|jgi:type I restriction enzyme S subunit|nr:restriction endonuclease subunit S [Syntrophaceae bacterium]
MGSEWRTVKLGDIAENASRPFDFSKHERVVFINTGDVLHGKFLHSNRIVPKDLPGQAKKRIEKNDILFSEIRPANKRYALVDFDPEEYVVSTKFIVIKLLSEEIDPHFFYIQLTCDKTLCEFQRIAESRSGTFPQITFDSVAYYPFILPPLPEQRAIAHILGSLDDKIELNRKMNKTLEAIARATFKSWFIDFDPVIDNALRAGNPIPDSMAERAEMRRQILDQNQPSSSSQRAKDKNYLEGFKFSGLGNVSIDEIYELFPDSFQNSELGAIPKGWEVKSLGELCEKPQYGFTTSAKDKKVGPKFLRITDINKLPWVEWSNVPWCEIISAGYDKYKLRIGDFLIARMADPGHGVYIEEEVEAVFASYLIRFRPVDLRYGRYMQYWQHSSIYWNLINARKAGTTRFSLNAKDLSAFPMLIPTFPILEAFSVFINPIRQIIVHNVQESMILTSLRDTLLPKLISGELRVPDAVAIIKGVEL